MTYYIPKKGLLTCNNAKTVKGEKKGYKTYVLYMSPHKLNSKKFNMCPYASPGCIASCLYGSGRGGISTVQKGRTNKTEFFLEDKEKFMLELEKQISKLIVKYGDILAIRLNGTSDVEWEKIPVGEYENIFLRFPNTTFYDYTKNPNRFENLPKNYSLIFSRSENNEEQCLEFLKKGINVAMVFDQFPKNMKYKGYWVVNGDSNDLRFKDKKSRIVGVHYKRSNIKTSKSLKAAVKTGFMIQIK